MLHYGELTTILLKKNHTCTNHANHLGAIMVYYFSWSYKCHFSSLNGNSDFFLEVIWSHFIWGLNFVKLAYPSSSLHTPPAWAVSAVWGRRSLSCCDHSGRLCWTVASGSFSPCNSCTHAGRWRKINCIIFIYKLGLTSVLKLHLPCLLPFSQSGCLWPELSVGHTNIFVCSTDNQFE